MKTNFLILLLLLSCLACKNDANENTKEEKTEIAFNAAKWKVQQDKDYPYRAKMLNNLIAGDTLKKLKKEGILELLGEPSRTDHNYLFYMVSQERLEFWPMHTKSLVIKFTKDNSVEWVKIHE